MCRHSTVGERGAHESASKLRFPQDHEAKAAAAFRISSVKGVGQVTRCRCEKVCVGSNHDSHVDRPSPRLAHSPLGAAWSQVPPSQRRTRVFFFLFSTWTTLQESELRFLEFSLSIAVSSLPVADSVKRGSTKKRLKTSRAPSRWPAFTSK